jgi:serine/threonine-protein kinase
MTAEAPDYSNLKQTADELWTDGGDRPTSLDAMTAQSAARVECNRTSRYETGAIIAGKYQLAEALGEGGMGSVWVAKNRTLEVDVAIKLMRAEFAENVGGIAERMLQEARAAACIGHPAIIQVFDFGFAEHGDPFIVMELLRGESLAQALRRRRCVAPARAVQTLLPIIDALGATHARGIVHRDLKPANIFLSRPAGQRLQPKVLDFGVAKLERHAAERLTQEGAMVGSPAYMSPEQFTGTVVVDGRADMWSLCVVLYEMITGHRPFESTNPATPIWGLVMNAEPRPIAEHGIDDPELWQILRKGFAKDPAGRFDNMHSFGRSRAQWLVAQGIQDDICDASLRTWIDPADTGVQRAHSFFPSQEPAAPKPQVIAVDAPIPDLRGGFVTGVRRQVQSVNQAPRARPANAQHRFAWIAGICAFVAFLVAAALAGRRPSPAEPVAHRRFPAIERHTPPALPPSTPPVPVPSEAPRLIGHTTTTSPRSVPEPRSHPIAPATTAPRTRRAPPPVRRNKPTQDLKNPFG